MKSSRKYLSAQGLLGIIYSHFKTVKPARTLAPRSNPITLSDCLMSGLAMFSLKFPSLLKFDEAKEDRQIKHNLRTLFHVKQTPSDTYMRERNDEVDPKEIRKVYKKIFAQVQRGKGLEEFEYFDKHYLLAGDGTGFFHLIQSNVKIAVLCTIINAILNLSPSYQITYPITRKTPMFSSKSLCSHGNFIMSMMIEK